MDSMTLIEHKFLNQICVHQSVKDYQQNVERRYLFCLNPVDPAEPLQCLDARYFFEPISFEDAFWHDPTIVVFVRVMKTPKELQILKVFLLNKPKIN